MSKLLHQVHTLLGIKSIRTSPYHPQTDGLVGRYNQTLKAMLRKVLLSEKRSWDKLLYSYLPMVMFAYREVPQASTGFSPFELIYGRDVRGPLDILRDNWLPSQQGPSDAATYVTQLHERMQRAKAIVRKHCQQVQEKQKAWYDRKARQLKLSNGEQVLLLLYRTARRSYIASGKDRSQ